MGAVEGRIASNHRQVGQACPRAVQRLIDVRDGQEAIVDGASGPTLDDLSHMIERATSAQAARLRDRARTDATSGKPEQLADVLTTAMLAAMAETNETMLGAPALPSDTALDAVADVLCVLATADPENATTKTVREALDDVARRAEAGARKLKGVLAESGYQLMASTGPTVN